MISVYLLLTVTTFLFLFVIWESKNWVNVILRFWFFALVVFGLLVLGIVRGYISTP